MMNDQERYDPFGEDDDFQKEIADFKPKAAKGKKSRPQQDDVEKIAQARGFDNRTPMPRKPAKEPLKPLHFRLPESEVEAFHQEAYEEFGLKHGAKTQYFLKMWKAYREANSDVNS